MTLKLKILHVNKIKTIRLDSHFICKVGSIKYWNGMYLREEEDIKKRWQEYTEELYKKDRHDQIIMMVRSLTKSQTSWNVKSSAP